MKKNFSFEPEVFPALIYRMVKPRAVFLMFVNGKVVLTGKYFYFIIFVNKDFIFCLYFNFDITLIYHV